MRRAFELWYADDYPAHRGGNGTPLPRGWWYWFAAPGWVPDSDPIGPFETATDAAKSAVAMLTQPNENV